MEYLSWRLLSISFVISRVSCRHWPWEDYKNPYLNDWRKLCTLRIRNVWQHESKVLYLYLHSGRWQIFNKIQVSFAFYVSYKFTFYCHCFFNLLQSTSIVANMPDAEDAYVMNEIKKWSPLLEMLSFSLIVCGAIYLILSYITSFSRQ